MFVLFPRWSAARRQHAEDVARAKMEGYIEGYVKGYIEGLAERRTEGRIEGRDEKQQEWAAWNARRLQAAAKGEPFNELPPQ